jgi:hypothetical protein
MKRSNPHGIHIRCSEYKFALPLLYPNLTLIAYKTPTQTLHPNCNKLPDMEIILGITIQMAKLLFKFQLSICTMLHVATSTTPNLILSSPWSPNCSPSFRFFDRSFVRISSVRSTRLAHLILFDIIALSAFC